MNSRQRDLARHALGFPNKKNVSYRNHFCVGVGCDDHADWESMVVQGYAVKRTGPYWGGADMFHMTLRGALLARNPKEHLSRDDTPFMRAHDAEAKLRGETKEQQ